MTALKHLKTILLDCHHCIDCVTPIALMFAYSPFHDVNDFPSMACAITLRVPKNVPT